MRRRRSRASRHRSAEWEAAYTCPTCGESVVVPLDLSQGADQQYVGDCPVCCNPNVVHVQLEPAWDAPRVWAEAEQDPG